MSCASAGNCSAGGYYTDGSGTPRRSWSARRAAPGARRRRCPAPRRSTRAADAGINSRVVRLGGQLQRRRGLLPVTTPHGVYTSRRSWSPRVTAPGERLKRCPAPRRSTRAAMPGSVRCHAAAAGNCSAGGSYTDTADGHQAFVVSEIGGTWGTAKEVPGTPTLNKGDDAYVNSVSCASAGNCSAGGLYAPGNAAARRSWSPRPAAPGAPPRRCPAARRSTRAAAAITSVSCASAGNCSAGGYYTDSRQPAGHGGRRDERQLGQRSRGPRPRHWWGRARLGVVSGRRGTAPPVGNTSTPLIRHGVCGQRVWRLTNKS